MNPVLPWHYTMSTQIICQSYWPLACWFCSFILKSSVSCSLYHSPHSRKSSPGGGSSLGNEGVVPPWQGPGSLAKTYWWMLFLGHVSRKCIKNYIKFLMHTGFVLTPWSRWVWTKGRPLRDSVPAVPGSFSIESKKQGVCSSVAVSFHTCRKYSRLTRVQPKWRSFFTFSPSFLPSFPETTHHQPRGKEKTSLPAGLAALVCSGGSECSFLGNSRATAECQESKNQLSSWKSKGWEYPPPCHPPGNKALSKALIGDDYGG